MKKGIEITKLIQLLEDIDEADFVSIFEVGEACRESVLLFKHIQKRKRSQVEDRVVVIDGKTISSSQPKRAKRK